MAAQDHGGAERRKEKDMTVWIILAAVAALGLFAAALSYFTAIRVEKRLSQYQNDLVQKHSEEVENMYRQTRGWRHDLKTHIQTMKAHLALGEYDRLEEYLNELDADLAEVDKIVKTGNVRIDALLNSKLSLAQARGIPVEAKAIVPHSLPLSEVDLGIIVGNLMDNAMEACLRIGEEKNRFLRVYVDVLKDQLYIYVMNSVGEKPQKKGRLYLTTKDSRNHGFGLMRMDRVVAKYHGYLDRQNEDGVFATEVLLPL